MSDYDAIRGDSPAEHCVGALAEGGLRVAPSSARLGPGVLPKVSHLAPFIGGLHPL